MRDATSISSEGALGLAGEPAGPAAPSWALALPATMLRAGEAVAAGAGASPRSTPTRFPAVGAAAVASVERSEATGVAYAPLSGAPAESTAIFPPVTGVRLASGDVKSCLGHWPNSLICASMPVRSTGSDTASKSTLPSYVSG